MDNYVCIGNNSALRIKYGSGKRCRFSGTSHKKQKYW